MSTLFTQFRLKRRTAAEWATANTLAQGEPGFESDTGRLKIGTGSDSWAALPYVSNVRTGTASSLSGLVLGNGEVGYETDTRIMKVGNASTAWASLPSTINVRTNNTGGWASSSLVLGNGEIGYETNTQLMKVGNGVGTWNSLSYVSAFSLSDMMPLIGEIPATVTTQGGDSVYGYGRRIILPNYKVSQIEFYPTTQIITTATNVGIVNIYTSNSPGVVSGGGNPIAQSYPISTAAWNAAAAANTSVRATLTSDFKPDGIQAYIVAYQFTNGVTNLANPSYTLRGVAISGTAISWSSVSGFIATGAQLIGTNIIPGTILSTVSGSGGTITNATYPVQVTSPSVSGYPTQGNISIRYRTITDPSYIKVSNVTSFFVGGNATIAGAVTASGAVNTAINGAVTIKAIDSTAGILTVFKYGMLPYLQSGATIKADGVGKPTINIDQILVPGTVKYVVSNVASISGLSVNGNVNISGTVSSLNRSTDTGLGFRVTYINTSENFFTISLSRAVEQTVSGGTALIGAFSSQIQSITPLTAISDGSSERYYYGGLLTNTLTPFVFVSYNWQSNAPYFRFFTTEEITSAGGGDSVSQLTLAEAIGSVSTVTSVDARTKVVGECNILIPSSVSVLKRAGEEFNLYNKHVVSGKWSDNGVLDYAAPFGKQLNECLRLEPEAYTVGSVSGSLTVRDYTWNSIATKSFSVNVVNPTTSVTSVRYLPIGDSITHMNYYQERVIALNYISSPITAIGFSNPTSVTVTVTSNAGMAVGNVVNIVGATATGNDGSFTISALSGSTQFTLTNASGTAQSISGGVAVVNAIALSRVTGITASGGVATVSVSSVSGFSVGQSVTIAVYGAADAVNNVHGRIDSVNSGTNSFTIKNDRATNASGIYGSAIVGNVITTGTRVDIRNADNKAGPFGRASGFSMEGRGGFRLSTQNGLSYFERPTTTPVTARKSGGFDSPFMSPSGLPGNVYRGNTEFWKRAVAVDRGASALYRLSGPAPDVGTNVTVTGASNGIYNGTFAVVTLTGNDFTCFVAGNDFAGGNSNAGTTATWSGGSADVVSVTSLKYDYNGYGRASREGNTGLELSYNPSGYPKSPLDGWIVFDPLIGTSPGSMMRYNASGASWTVDSTVYTWEFNYPKYLARYPWAFPGGDTPTHVSILLAANDYNGEIADDSAKLNTWIQDYRSVVTSIQQADPPPFVIILLPTLPSRQDGYANDYGSGVLAERARRNFQNVSTALITEFDNDTDKANKVRVSLFGGGIDPIYGSGVKDPEPPNKYITTSSLFIRRAAEGIHPTKEGLYQAGDFLAATIQSTR